MILYCTCENENSSQALCDGWPGTRFYLHTLRELGLIGLAFLEVQSMNSKSGAKPSRPRRAKRGKSQRRTEITRSAALNAAMREFAQLGLAGARVDRIAERAGINKQALYYHFGNKEQLFAATLAAVYDQGLPVPEVLKLPELTPPAAMRVLINAMFVHFRTIEDGTSVIAHENRYRGKHLTPSIRKRIRTSLAPLIAAIDDVLTRGQHQGVFNTDVSTNDLYLTLVAMSMFYFDHAYTLSSIVEYDLLDESAVAAWQTHVENFVLAALRPAAVQKSTK